MYDLTRGELIRTGAAGLAVLALANCARRMTPAIPPFDDPDYTYRVLSGGDRVMIAAVARGLLTDSLPADPAANAVALVAAVRGVDVAVAGLPPGVQGEIQQLFGLLQFPLTRGFAAGVWTSWGDASTAQVAAFLSRWRYSGVALLRSGYQALHQLVMASWYGNSASWARIGYPGPPVIGR